MDPLKEAFSKIKNDISNLYFELNSIKDELKSISNKLSPKESSNVPTTLSTIPTQTSSKESFPTDKPTDKLSLPTDKIALEAFYCPNCGVSIGNEGVPTDKQTNQQTNQQTQNLENSSHNLTNDLNIEQDTTQQNPIYSPLSTTLKSNTLSDFKKAQEILNNLDSVKKTIRLKFKQLTPQEMLIFSTLYSLEEQKIEEITYKLLANNLNLSESSIRDYINRLTSKGIPIEKTRQNNKTITLKISSDLKNIATLATIHQLRDI